MKSPIKSKLLKNPGESLDKQVFDIFADKVVPYLFTIMFMTLFTITEWIRWYSDIPFNPWILTIVTLITWSYFFWRLRIAFKMAQKIKLGREGERAVGQYLERLREIGAQVFHDIPGQGFNLDHVIIHHSGIYVIETKTRSKPEQGEAKLTFDGETISGAGGGPDTKPIIQSKAGKSWLYSLLEESTGKRFPVRAVVVFPGWYIHSTPRAKQSDVWVLNPKALPEFIKKSQTKITESDVRLCAFHLSKYIRNS